MERIMRRDRIDLPTRVYQVFDGDRCSVGSWSTRGLPLALVALAGHPTGYMLICDERQSRGMRSLGLSDLVVVRRVEGCAA